MKHLLPHNLKTYNKVMKMLTERNICCIQQPTGTGKSYIIDAVSQHKSMLLIAPTLSILDQWKNNFGMDRVNVTYSTYASLHKYKETYFDLVVFDEFHRTGAKKWQSRAHDIINNIISQNGWIFGVTATPIHRVEGDMCRKTFKGNIASQLTLKEAFKKGILFPPRYRAVQYKLDIDIDDLNDKIHNTNMTKTEKKEILDKLQRTKNKANDMQGIGKIITSNLPANPKGIIFAKNTAQVDAILEDIAIWFAGYKTKVFVVHYRVNNPIEVINEYAEFNDPNTVTIIISIGMLNEGIHAEGTNFCIFLRPTKSNIIYCQQMGRLLTTAKKDTVVIDLVNNIKTLRMLKKVKKLGIENSGIISIENNEEIDSFDASLIEVEEIDCDLCEILDSIKDVYMPDNLAIDWLVYEGIENANQWKSYRKANTKIPRIPKMPEKKSHGFWQRVKQQSEEFKEELELIQLTCG